MRLVVVLAFAVGCRRELCADCDPAAEFCVIYGSDVASVPSTSECRPFPAECSDDHSCGCLAESSVVNDVSCILTDQCTEEDVVTEVCPGG